MHSILLRKNSLDMWAAFLTKNDLVDKDNLPDKPNSASLKKALTVLDIMNSPKKKESL
ncbi:MAG: hypothetical protein MTP17_04455 [Candidatus Midichloria sp.]|nr:MAG: hypothetical protein MTP17_04455 [Candidatus Midichloria sp.]